MHVQQLWKKQPKIYHRQQQEVAHVMEPHDPIASPYSYPPIDTKCTRCPNQAAHSNIEQSHINLSR